ncbi:MAG TPA: LysE family translocator [Pseudonocardiaceae bacterium]|nr:LysE family translocator [Pseudonocardiaceae bacterium]
MSWLPMVGFGLAVLPICLTPGVSFTLVTQRVLDRGVPSGLAVTAGTAGGLVCHATLAGLGLSALVMRSSEAFTVVKFIGAAYLVLLGLRTLWKSRPGQQTAPQPTPTRKLPWTGHGDLVQGFLGNVLNPKAAAVYLTVAPQFLHAGAPLLPQMLELCLAHIVVAAGWLIIWTTIVHLSRRTVRSPSFRRVMDRITGVVLVGLGLRTGLATR